MYICVTNVKIRHVWSMKMLNFFLYQNCMMEHYKAWSQHGEKEEALKKKKQKRISEKIVEEPFDLNAFLRYVSGVNYDDAQDTSGSNFEHPTNTDAS